MTTARDVMNRGAQCITEDQTLLEGAKLMKELGIGSLPIQAAGGELTGMLTDRDIVVGCVAAGLDPGATTAGSVAAGNVQTVDVEAPIEDVLGVMRQHQVKRLPVLSDRSVVGMISESDLVAELTNEQVGQYAEGVYKRD